MKVMVMVKATADSEAGTMPSEQLLSEMGNFNEELVKAGIMLAGEGLHPSSKGARVRFSGKNRTVIDGPFPETKELVAGYWIWQVKSLDEAIRWVKRCPNPMLTDSEIEIRQVFSMEDFGDAMTPELKAQEERLSTAIEKLNESATQPAGNAIPAPARCEDGKELLIAGLKQRYSLASRGNIPAQWHKFAPHIGKVPGQVGTSSFGVSWNSDAKCDFDYLSGVEVTEITGLPQDFSHLRIASQHYAVFEHRGHISSLGQTLEGIWTRWLPSSGRQAAPAPCFERYTDRFDPKTGTGTVEIWVPLKA